MANVTNKIFVDKMGGRSSTEYIGVPGEIFYDPSVGDLRLADGRPGGRPVLTRETAPYRGFQAGCNQFLNSVKSNITQIIIHNAKGVADYINYTDYTGSDDFYATNLRDAQADRATKVIALNLYSAPSGEWWTGASSTLLSVDNIHGFVRKFIDLVLYDEQDNPINDINAAKASFYANIDTLVATLPNGTLFQDFTFDDGGRVAYPEYNATDNNTSANFKVVQWNSYDGPRYDWNTSIMFRSCGTGYNIGDKITVNGGQLFGKDGENDFTLNVTSTKSGNITGLTMTYAGTGHIPNARIGKSNTDYDMSFSNTSGEGYDSWFRINTVNANGEIQDWELTYDGRSYQVGDTLTFNSPTGGDAAEFEVTSVGTGGIDNWILEGNAYYGSPARVPNGYWPQYCIDDGSYDQYNEGNFLSTEQSTSTWNVDILGRKLTIIGNVKGGISLQPGMRGVIQVPWEELPYTFTLINQATDNSDIWYIDNYVGDFSGVNVRFDSISYNNGNTVIESQEFNGGDYTVMFDKGVFALMSFGANVNSLYYNGTMGAKYPWSGQYDKDGYKQIDVVLGAHGGPDSVIQIPSKRIWDNNYTLITADAGRNVYYDNGGSNNVYIPNDGVTNFPVGTAITIVSGGDGRTYINATDPDITSVWGAGFDQTSSAWYIPANSMATIIKVAGEKWILSGAGLAID